MAEPLRHPELRTSGWGAASFSGVRRARGEGAAGAEGRGPEGGGEGGEASRAASPEREYHYHDHSTRRHDPGI